MSSSSTGRKKTDEEISKIRISKIERVKSKIKTGINPRYNPEACKIISNYGNNNGFNFIHAENGGEFFVKEVGCFLDGYDKTKNIVIEFYERFHYNEDGTLKEKDIRRESLIINKLKCGFIRINAFSKKDIKFEIII